MISYFVRLPDGCVEMRNASMVVMRGLISIDNNLISIGTSSSAAAGLIVISAEAVGVGNNGIGGHRIKLILRCQLNARQARRG